MKQTHAWWSGLTAIAVVAAIALIAAVPAAADPGPCSSGAHTLSKFGDRVYTEMGNGGYPCDISDEEWGFVAAYLTWMTEEAPQRPLLL